MKTFLLGAHAGGVTSGSHALFYIDAEGDFSMERLTGPDTSSPSVNVTMDYVNDVERAAQALFVLRSSPVSSLHSYINNSVQQVMLNLT